MCKYCVWMQSPFAVFPPCWLPEPFSLVIKSLSAVANINEQNRYNAGAHVLCSKILLTANVTPEIDSFPSAEKQIFVQPFYCPYKENRPPVTDPLVTLQKKKGGEQASIYSLNMT